jgi:hypothetical protein
MKRFRPDLASWPASVRAADFADLKRLNPFRVLAAWLFKPSVPFVLKFRAGRV